MSPAIPVSLASKLFLGAVLFLGLVLAGCSTSTETEVSVSPAVVSTATPLPSPSPVATVASPSPTAQPTVSPEQQLSDLRDAVGPALFQAVGVQFAFTSDRDPSSGILTYYGTGSANTFNFQVKINKAISRLWQPDLTLARKTGASGRTKTIAYTQSLVGLDKVQTEMQMECNNFGQIIMFTLTESKNPALPYQNYGEKGTLALIDVCP